jgi:hypothetical protein
MAIITVPAARAICLFAVDSVIRLRDYNIDENRP